MPIEIQPQEIQVWLARPDEVRNEQWDGLGALLDGQEHARAAQFKLEADRRAYVLVHALRRRALSQALAVEPFALAFDDEPGTRPVLTRPQSHGYFFSHSRRRGLVAFALTSLQPVGIDVEALQERPLDFNLLSRFVQRPDTAQLGRDPAHQFCFYWTALEAFWKAEGTGLVAGNARMRCTLDDAGRYQLGLENEAAARARLIDVAQPAGHMVALAVKHSRGTRSRVDQAAICLRSGNELVD